MRLDHSKVIRYPNLDTIIMVENFISENSGDYKRKQLWESLPKKMMYQTFSTILAYLHESNKIRINTSGFVEWIHTKTSGFRRPDWQKAYL